MKRRTLFVSLIVLALFGVNTLAAANPVKPKRLPHQQEKATEQVNRNTHSSLDAVGGPDVFNYMYVDNQTPDTAAYDWIELINTDASRITDWPGTGTWREGQVRIDMGDGFTFPYYGQECDSIYVYTYGLLSIPSLSRVSGSNSSLPTFNKTIYPFWSDLRARVSGRGQVWYKYFSEEDYFVVEWDSVSFADDPTVRFSFETILYGDGKIKMQYKSLGDEVSHTVGIQGIYYSCVEYGYVYIDPEYPEEQGEPVTNERAIWFYQDSPEHDFACVELIAPEYYAYSINELANVEAVFINAGTTTESATVSYRIVGEAITSEVTSVLAPMASEDYTFTTQLAFPSTPGDYDFKIWADAAGDANRSNDTITVTFSVVAPPPCTVLEPIGAILECEETPGEGCNDDYSDASPIASGDTYYSNTFVGRDSGRDYDYYGFFAGADTTNVTISIDTEEALIVYLLKDLGAEDIFYESVEQCATGVFTETLLPGQYHILVFADAPFTADPYHYTISFAATEINPPCDAPGEVVIAYDYLSANRTLSFEAAQSGDYSIYRTTNPNNNGDPRNGNPDFSVEDVINVSTPGTVTWTDTDPLDDYTNYVVVQTTGCASIGRCCYFVSGESTCADLRFIDCYPLEGVWDASKSCATDPCGCANDDCEDAIAIQNGETSGDNALAEETSNPAEADCAGEIYNDVWYSYTAAADGEVTMSTCGGTSWDSILEVFTGTCGDLTSFACNDDADECEDNGLASTLSFTAISGTTYLVRVGSYGSGSSQCGPFVLTVTGP